MPDRDGYSDPARVEDEYNDYESAPKATTGSSTSQDFDIYHVRRVVAGNPNTPRQVLSRLAEDKLSAIRRRVAENPRTPVDVLTRLASDADPDVRLAVAENANTPPEILATLSEDEDVDVRYGVAENPHMPEDILLKLSEDDNPYVRCRALKTLQTMSPDVQSRLQLLMQPGYGSSLGQHL
jgi:hypothetical protein